MSALGARCRTRAILRERALAAALVSLSVLAIGRSTKLCEGTGGEADPAAANTSRRSHRWRSPSSSGVFAATAAIATFANRVCTCRAGGNTCFEQECAGADKRLIPGVHVVGCPGPCPQSQGHPSSDGRVLMCWRPQLPNQTDVCFWPKADTPVDDSRGSFRGQGGHPIFTASRLLRPKADIERFIRSPRRRSFA